MRRGRTAILCLAAECDSGATPVGGSDVSGNRVLDDDNYEKQSDFHVFEFRIRSQIRRT